jgi:hypothetical protein
MHQCNKMHECTNARMHECTNTRVQACSCALVPLHFCILTFLHCSIYLGSATVGSTYTFFSASWYSANSALMPSNSFFTAAR